MSPVMIDDGIIVISVIPAATKSCKTTEKDLMCRIWAWSLYQKAILLQLI